MRLGRGVFVFDEDTHTLRLKSELFDLRVGYANPSPREFARRADSRASDCDIKINTIHEGWCSFLWRRKRDSNPRAFWANGFQDRLVVTASIFLHITATHRAAVICREYLHGSEKFIFQNPLRIPHDVIGELAHQ